MDAPGFRTIERAYGVNRAPEEVHAMGTPTGDDRGFTLVELLVTLVVLGILAAIVAPNLLKQREKAWRSALKADLHSAATANEAWATDNGGYVLPGIAAVTQLESEGFRASPDVTLVVVDDEMASGGYCLRAEHASLGSALYLAGGGAAAGEITATPCVAS